MRFPYYNQQPLATFEFEYVKNGIDVGSNAFIRALLDFQGDFDLSHYVLEYELDDKGITYTITYIGDDET